MDWYQYYKDSLSGTVTDVFTGDDLYIALCMAISQSTFSTKDDLRDLTRAYEEYKEELKNESVNRSISAAV